MPISSVVIVMDSHLRLNVWTLCLIQPIWNCLTKCTLLVIVCVTFYLLLVTSVLPIDLFYHSVTAFVTRIVCRLLSVKKIVNFTDLFWISADAYAFVCWLDLIVVAVMVFCGIVQRSQSFRQTWVRSRVKSQELEVFRSAVTPASVCPCFFQELFLIPMSSKEWRSAICAAVSYIAALLA